MVSDSELIEKLKEFLRNADLDKTTTGTVRRMLEEDFAIDLSDKKPFIREQVDLFLQNEFDNDQKNGDNDYTPEDQTVNVETDGCDMQAEQDDEDEDEEKSDVKGGLVIYDVLFIYLYYIRQLFIHFLRYLARILGLGFELKFEIHG